MPDRVEFPAFRDQLSRTGYPFAPGATLANDAGDVIPPGLLLDAALYAVGGREGAYLASVGVAYGRVTLAVGDAGDPARSAGRFDPADPPDAVALSDALGRPAGLLVSEPARLAALAGWGAGSHAFTPDQSAFAAGVCVPAPDAGLRAVSVGGGLLAGELWLVGENGVVLSTSAAVDPSTGESVTVVRVDCVGDPLAARALCAGQGAFATPRFVRKLRVVTAGRTFLLTPDAYGDVQLNANNAAAADTVLRVRTTPGGVYVDAVGAAIGG